MEGSGKSREAMAVAEGLHPAVAALAIPHGRAPREVVAIGLGGASSVPDGEDSAARLFDVADRALYRAKEGGRDRACLGGDGEALPSAPAGAGPSRSRSRQFHSLG